MVRAIMHGCNGKMGQVITNLVKEDEEIEIVAGIDTYTGLKNAYPVYADISECEVEADVVIDFSNALAMDGLLEHCEKKQIPVVLCTTGLSVGAACVGTACFREGCGVKIRKYVTGDQSVVKTSAGCGKDPCSGRI